MQRCSRLVLLGFATLLIVAPAHGGSGILLNDGSFEQGPPPGSAWTEGAIPPACEWIVDNATLATVFDASTVAKDGDWVYWAGGYCPVPTASIDSLSQSVEVPIASFLSIWYQIRRGDPDDDDLDVAYISMNDEEIWSIPISTANDQGPVWVNEWIPVPAQYHGTTVDLTVGNRAVGLTGNCLFDLFEWQIGLPTKKVTWGEVKSTFHEAEE